MLLNVCGSKLDSPTTGIIGRRLLEEEEEVLVVEEEEDDVIVVVILSPITTSFLVFDELEERRNSISEEKKKTNNKWYLTSDDWLIFTLLFAMVEIETSFYFFLARVSSSRYSMAGWRGVSYSSRCGRFSTYD